MNAAQPIAIASATSYAAAIASQLLVHDFYFDDDFQKLLLNPKEHSWSSSLPRKHYDTPFLGPMRLFADQATVNRAQRAHERVLAHGGPAQADPMMINVVFVPPVPAAAYTSTGSRSAPVSFDSCSPADQRSFDPLPRLKNGILSDDSLIQGNSFAIDDRVSGKQRDFHVLPVHSLRG